MVNFHSLDPGIFLGHIDNMPSDSTDRFPIIIILADRELARRLFENNGRYRNIRRDFAINDIATGRIAHPGHIGKEPFQAAPNRLQLFGFQNRRMNLEIHCRGTMFLVPLVKQRQFAFELRHILKGKDSVFHTFIPKRRANLDTVIQNILYNISKRHTK